MTCPKCESSRVGCIDTRKKDGEVWRRKQCQSCGFRFNTRETYEDELIRLQIQDAELKRIVDAMDTIARIMRTEVLR